MNGVGWEGVASYNIKTIIIVCSAAAAAVASQTWKMAAAGQNTTKTIGGN